MSIIDYLIWVGLIIFALILHFNWDKIKAILFPKSELTKRIRICPKCGSKNVQLSKLGDPLKTEGMIGYDCNDCSYTGRAFVTGDQETVKKYRQSKKKSK